jgi:hypothetical protein
MIENYIFKQDSDINKFFYENQKISLREYQKDLLLYWSGEEDKCEYALVNKSPDTIEGITICADGKFGSYSKLSKKISFDGANLESLQDNIHLSFWLAASEAESHTTVFLRKKGTWETLPVGDYSFCIQVDGEIQRTAVFTLKKETTFNTLKNKINFELDPSKYKAEVDAEQTTNEVVAVKSTTPGKNIIIFDGAESNNLMDFLEVSSVAYGTIPTKEYEISSLAWETGSLKISHVKAEENGITLSKLKFVYKEGEVEKMTTIPWNNNAISLDNVEVDIDSSVMYIFLNGELLKAVLISPIKRAASKTVLTLGSDEKEYCFEEVIVKSKLQHKEDFAPATTQLTKYDTSRPYIDFHYSGKNIFAASLTDLVAECSDNISLVLNYDGLFYYYSAGDWRSSDGSYQKSNDSYTFADYIKEFAFTGKDDLFIRAYFESDGDTEAWIQNLYFTVNEGSIYGDEKATAAILVGEKEFEENETVEVGDKGLKITTDQGTTDIVFPNNMTIEEIVAYIKSQYPEGIASVYKDKVGRLVLVSETKGDNAYIVVSGDAADLLFGKTKSAQGTNPEKDTLKQNYEEFIEKVKEYSSNDLIPIEIKDEQIRLYLDEAINLYKKYRNDEENTYKVQLEGNPTDGYLIPQVIGDWHDITDILFKPLFPIGFYTGSFDNDLEDIVSLSFLNAMTGRGGFNNFYGKGFVTDYYISLMSIDSMEMALGLQPSWKVYNNRLYIFPNNITKYLTVTICYKAPIDPIKALRDPYIIQYVYGKIRMAQGEVRGQYGSQLSSGGLPVTLNGDSMYERGKAACQEALENMKKEQEPLGFFFG